MSELRKAVIKNADMTEDMQQVCIIFVLSDNVPIFLFWWIRCWPANFWKLVQLKFNSFAKFFFRMLSTAPLRRWRSTTSRRMLPPTSRRSSTRSTTRLGMSTISCSCGKSSRVSFFNRLQFCLPDFWFMFFINSFQALHCRPQLWLIRHSRD